MTKITKKQVEAMAATLGRTLPPLDGASDEWGPNMKFRWPRDWTPLERKRLRAAALAAIKLKIG